MCALRAHSKIWPGSIEAYTFYIFIIIIVRYRLQTFLANINLDARCSKSYKSMLHFFIWLAKIKLIKQTELEYFQMRVSNNLRAALVSAQINCASN